MSEINNIPGIQTFDSHPFFSNSQVINHQPDKVMVDFQMVAPQFGPNNEVTMTVSHRLIVLDPHVAKNLHKALGENLEKYEKSFGKIDVPDAIRKAEKDHKKSKSLNVDKPTYYG